MFLEFYGLAKDPFSLSPDLDFLFPSNAHEETVAHLMYGLAQGEDIILITGDIGTGKTLALYTLFTKLSGDFVPVSINVTTLDFEPFLKLILKKLDREVAPQDGLGEMLFRLERVLVAHRSQGRKVLLIVDEAQNLTETCLEGLRLLTNLAQPGGQAMQLILAGQLGLRPLLEKPALRQLLQRIRVEYQLGYLNRQEMEEYINHRLRASGRTEPLFQQSALDRIYLLSRGVPRLVNVLAGKALLSGFVEEDSLISAKHIEDLDPLVINGDHPACGHRQGPPSRVRPPVPSPAAAMSKTSLPRKPQTPPPGAGGGVLDRLKAGLPRQRGARIFLATALVALALVVLGLVLSPLLGR